MKIQYGFIYEQFTRKMWFLLSPAVGVCKGFYQEHFFHVYEHTYRFSIIITVRIYITVV